MSKTHSKHHFIKNDPCVQKNSCNLNPGVPTALDPDTRGTLQIAKTLLAKQGLKFEAPSIEGSNY